MNAIKRELSDYVPLDSNFSEAYKKASQAIYTERSNYKRRAAPRGNGLPSACTIVPRFLWKLI